MQITDRIDAIRTRAEAINLTLAEVCRKARVHYSTLQRWRSGECDPGVRSFDETLGRLEAWLADEELRIISNLQTQAGTQSRPAA